MSEPLPHDFASDPAAVARVLGISRAAVELYLASEIIDLHIDSFIWTRVFGYDLTKRHGRGLLGARLYSQVDFPRIRSARIGGAIWVITTNPLRTSRGRARVFPDNVRLLLGILGSVANDFAVVRSAADYRAARAQGKHAALIGVQGGNALAEPGADVSALVDGTIVRVTLVHLTSSSFGTTSSPLRLGSGDGLTAQGKSFIELLNQHRVFVDLAHISRRGFWDAVDVHDPRQPLIVTHTGVASVTPHWRNLDDAQIRKIADSGGTVGIMYHGEFLGDSRLGGRAESIVRHLEHVIQVAGEDHASLGSDWDGSICTPRDMPTCLELPRLVQIMLDRGWQAARIRKVLGENFLRVLEALRG